MSSVKLSAVLSAMSYALDLTEGQPQGLRRAQLSARDAPGGGTSTHALTMHARILAAADVFNALSVAPPYRGPTPLDQVLSLIQEGRGREARASRGLIRR